MQCYCLRADWLRIRPLEEPRLESGRLASRILQLRVHSRGGDQIHPENAGKSACAETGYGPDDIVAGPGSPPCARKITPVIQDSALIQRESSVDNLLVRSHCIIVMIKWTGLARWQFDFVPCSLASTVLGH